MAVFAVYISLNVTILQNEFDVQISQFTSFISGPSNARGVEVLEMYFKLWELVFVSENNETIISKPAPVQFVVNIRTKGGKEREGACVY